MSENRRPRLQKATKGRRPCIVSGSFMSARSPPRGSAAMAAAEDPGKGRVGVHRGQELRLK